MKSCLYLMILLIISNFVFSQISISNQLKIYPEPPYEAGVNRHNDEFSVRVRNPGGTWRNLYEYKTYVNSGPSRGTNEPSSFITFDFNGTVEIEITSSNRPINSVIIRPQSRGIPYTQLSSNKVSFLLSKPDQLSFEINGDRYRNMQIFANPMEVTPPANATKIFRANVINNLPGNRYIAQDNDIIYFEPGAIVKGNIYVEGKENVHISGRGIIDLTHLRKQYITESVPADYEYLQGISIFSSENIDIKDVIVNDAQGSGVGLDKSDHINISNIKMFSRTIWGDGINMTASNYVNIDDCYIRTADDGIAVYPTRVREWENDYTRDATNIFVNNISLYSDAAHPIEIGYHGSQQTLNRRVIYYVVFNDINILEHDEPHEHYKGAISINCADENICQDILINNIYVEDFTNGRLFTIKTEPANYGAGETPGSNVRRVVFDNLYYNGTGETASVIEGLSCERFVEGIHFSDLTINGLVIENLSDYLLSNGSPGFQTNQHAYNITFQEADNYSEILNTGTYRIKNKQNNRYLTNLTSYSPLDNNGFYTATSPLVSTSNYQKWQLTKVAGHYRIKNVGSNNFLHNSDEIYVNDCKSRYIWSYPNGEYMVQEWKIVPKGSGNYTINNAYTRGYLLPSAQSVNGNIQAKYIINSEKNGLDDQLWTFEPISIIGGGLDGKYAKTEVEFPVLLSPVPFSDFLQIENIENINSWSLTDINGKTVESWISDGRSGKITINTSKLNSGIYYFNAIKLDGELFQKNILKK